MTAEVHEFGIDKSIIIHLIESQAGTLGKGVLETVMNSVDAGATAIDIDLTSEQLVITDNGDGMQSRDEILACFKVFGFDHTNHDRRFGRFGLGRAQLWNWVSSVWRTGTFELDVNVRERGLHWYLSTDREPCEGLTITSRFYTPLTEVEKYDLIADIERLCKYSAVPVTVNGRQVSTDASASKWDVETESAYIKVTDGSYLKVYNQGIFVADIYRGQSGIAGTVVTKQGHNLTLNIARNDVLRAKCPVWKEIEKACAALASERHSSAKVRVTHADRAYMARLTADPANIKLMYEPIFTLANGRNVGLGSILNSLRARIPLSVAESGNRMADQILRERGALVFATMTLERFGATSIKAMLETIRERVERAPAQSLHNTSMTVHYLKQATIYESIEQCPTFRALQANRIPKASLTPAQRSLLPALSDLSQGVARLVGTGIREAYLATGEGLQAFTDGTSYVGVVDVVADQAAKSGVNGFLRLTHLMVHEYLHDTETAGSHQHDQEFYEGFHDLVLHKADVLFDLAKVAFSTYASSCKRLTKRQAQSLDLASKLAPQV